MPFLLVCNIGYYLDADTCTKCVQGTYKDEVGNEATLCLECPTGKSTTDTGNAASTDCGELTVVTLFINRQYFMFIMIYNNNTGKVKIYRCKGLNVPQSE